MLVYIYSTFFVAKLVRLKYHHQITRKGTKLFSWFPQNSCVYAMISCYIPLHSIMQYHVPLKYSVITHHILVGGIPTALKNMSSSVGMIIPNIWEKNVPSSKPYIGNNHPHWSSIFFQILEHRNIGNQLTIINHY